MYINTEIADKYQEFFNFFIQEHNLILTIEQMQEILSEAQKLESKLSQHDVIKNEVTVCDCHLSGKVQMCSLPNCHGGIPT
jgi:hypothetical protein